MTTLDFGKAKEAKIAARGLLCVPCDGKGFRKGECATCANVGLVHPREPRYYGCPDCDNARCRACGGSGRPPVPATLKGDGEEV